MTRMLQMLKKVLPTSLVSLYHFALAHLGAFIYRHPSRELLVVGVTGTKGKSSTTELVNSILEEAGYTTAVLSSIRIKIGSTSNHNTDRSMPGRFFIQRFLRSAISQKCSAAVIEMTSEGARQHRHRAIELDALVFTNLAPEHIESHGSYEAYANAKFEIGLQLARSRKRPRIVAANANDDESARYLALPVEKILPFSLDSNRPWTASEHGGYFTLDSTKISISLPGEFSLKNALAASTLARALDITPAVITRALEKVSHIPGRAERIDAGQEFTVVVDYAHTPDSLEALYNAYKSTRKICVASATGGGRDNWKRPVMGAVADTHCNVVILTDEDPYDEDPRTIVEAMANGMKRKPEIIMDRRAAIRRACELAEKGDAVLITGKGTDAYIHGPRGKNTPWSDVEVAREELQALLKKQQV